MSQLVRGGRQSVGAQVRVEVLRRMRRLLRPGDDTAPYDATAYDTAPYDTAPDPDANHYCRSVSAALSCWGPLAHTRMQMYDE